MSALWVGYPRSYTPGRARPIQFVTLHYTAGSEGPTSAENGAVYDKTRTDGTSTHYFTDSQGPALQEVPDGDRSHTALFHGNEIGIHVEICGTRQTRAQWLDPVSMATLTTTAALVRELCDRHGLPRRRLSVDETRAAYYGKDKPKGINDHYACTLAFPEDGGDHTDVGPEFPWDVLMQFIEGGTTVDGQPVMTSASPQQGDIDAGRIEALTLGLDAVRYGPTAFEKVWIVKALKDTNAKLDALLTALSAGVPVSVKLSPEELAAIADAAEAGAEAGAPTAEELQAAAFAGAQRAEDE